MQNNDITLIKHPNNAYMEGINDDIKCTYQQLIGEEATGGGGQGHQRTTRRGLGWGRAWGAFGCPRPPSGSPLDSVFVPGKN